MTLIVQKFGGSSLATPQHIKRVARRVAGDATGATQICLVVSAMGKTTDQLVELADTIATEPHAAAMDALLSTGEQVSSALMVMALRELGIDAVALTGAAAGIVTDAAHGAARILDIDPGPLRAVLERGALPVVAGFQGAVQHSAAIATLGRGGSDTTAVALAAALGADRCEIYTDVDGVLTADPRLVADACVQPQLAFDEMLELSVRGAKVLMDRSVDYARRHGVAVAVKPAHGDAPGTLITSPRELAERPLIAGVAHDLDTARFTVTGVPARAAATAWVLGELASIGVSVDMIVQNLPDDGRADLSFTVPESALRQVRAVLAPAAERLGCGELVCDADVGKVSVSGAGMSGHPGVATKLLETLADAGVDVELICTSSISISCLVRADDVVRSVRAIHAAFDLDSASAVAGAFIGR